GVFAFRHDGWNERLDHAGAVHDLVSRRRIALAVANLRAGAAAHLALEYDIVRSEGDEGFANIQRRRAVRPHRRDDRDAERGHFPQVGLADIPANRGRRVEDRNAARGDAVERREKVLVTILIVPGAVDQHGGKTRPVDVRPGPAHRLDDQTLGGEALLQDVELDVEEVGVGAAIWRS